MFKLAEIDPCQKHACPRQAGGARSALAIAVVLHAAVIAALAAITLAQPGRPAAGWNELEASFAPAPRPAPDPRVSEVHARHQPQLIAELGERQSTIRQPTPTPLAIPAPSPPPDPPQDGSRRFEEQFIPAKKTVSDEVTPPSRPETSAPGTDNSARNLPEKAPAPASPKFLPARVRSTSRPNYPSSAMRRSEEGVAQVRLSLDADGKVTGAAISSSSGFAALDAAALKAAARWKFAPATKGGQPVASAIVVPIRFSLR